MESTDSDRTVAGEIANELNRAGVTKVFTIPGVHNMPLWWALGEAGIDRVLVRHEQAAMHAADGYARASGQLGVCMTTSGPGAANTAAATGEALTTGSPVLHLTTTPPSSLRIPGVRRGSVHELSDQVDIFRPLVKSVWVVERAEHVGSQLRAAVRDALTPWTGPVYVEVPTDVFDMPVSGDALPHLDARPFRKPTHSAIGTEALEAIVAAERPVLWVGAGSIGAPVAALADHLAAPVVTTLMARSAIDSAHPLAVGAPPHEPAVSALLDEADLVVALGTDFDGQVTQGWRMKIRAPILRVDVEASQLCVNARPEYPIHMTVERFVDEVLARVDARDDDSRAYASKWVASTQHMVRERIETNVAERDAFGLLDQLGRAIPDDSPVVADMTLMGYWASGYLRRSTPRTFMFPMGWGTLGFALPTAVGVAHATARPTVVFVGDAGLLFMLGELATVRERDLPLKVVVFNDRAYSMLEYGLPEHRDRSGLRDLTVPDIPTLGAAFGIDVVCTDHVGLPDVLDGELAKEGPSMIEVPNIAIPPVTTGIRWPIRAGAATDGVRP